MCPVALSTSVAEPPSGYESRGKGCLPGVSQVVEGCLWAVGTQTEATKRSEHVSNKLCNLLATLSLSEVGCFPRIGVISRNCIKM